MQSIPSRNKQKPKPRSRAEQELADLDAVMAALAHPARRQVLLSLHFHGDAMTAGEIASRFGCSWPTTSRHLKVLEGADLVQVETNGRERNYRLNFARLKKIVGDWLNHFDQ